MEDPASRRFLDVPTPGKFHELRLRRQRSGRDFDEVSERLKGSILGASPIKILSFRRLSDSRHRRTDDPRPVDDLTNVNEARADHCGEELERPSIEVRERNLIIVKIMEAERSPDFPHQLNGNVSVCRHLGERGMAMARDKESIHGEQVERPRGVCVVDLIVAASRCDEDSPNSFEGSSVWDGQWGRPHVVIR